MHASDWMTTHFKLAEHVQLIIFCPVAWKKVGTWIKRNLPQCLRRSVTALYVSTLCCGLPFAFDPNISKLFWGTLWIFKKMLWPPPFFTIGLCVVPPLHFTQIFQNMFPWVESDHNFDQRDGFLFGALYDFFENFCAPRIFCLYCNDFIE
jgi:hypothetical protein